MSVATKTPAPPAFADLKEQPYLIDPFALKYDGRDAASHFMEGEAYGVSVIGATKLYVAVAHYAALGLVPRGNYRKSFRCCVEPPARGSLDQWVFIAPIAGQYALHRAFYNEAIKIMFRGTVDALKRFWARPSEAGVIVDRMCQTIEKQAELTSNNLSEMVDALTKANDNLAKANDRTAALHDHLIETLPLLAEATRPHAKKLVEPVGKTCRNIIQFPDTDYASEITEAEAEAIRSDIKTEVDPVAQFKVAQISEINIRTGHCVLEVDGLAAPVNGKITDPALAQPDNSYTRALNDHSGLVVEGKAVRASGVVKRIFISNSVGETSE